MTKNQVKFDSKNASIQHFSIPFDALSYICKNSKDSHEILLKLYSLCKYFWPKIHVFPVNTLLVTNDSMDIENAKDKENYFSIKQSLDLPDYQFIVTKKLKILSQIDQDQDLASNLMVSCYLNLKILWAVNQNFTLEEYELISQNLEKVNLIGGKIVRTHLSSSSALTLPEIFNIGKKIEKFHFSPESDNPYKNEIFKSLCLISKPIKLHSFSLFDLMDEIDFDKIGNFIKKLAHSNFFLDLLWPALNRTIVEEYHKLIKDELKNLEGFDCIFLEEKYWLIFKVQLIKKKN